MDARYRIEASLGRGHFAECFRAQDDRLGRLVALKLFQPNPMQPEGAWTQALHEARRYAAVEHVNVIRVYDAGDDHGTPFIVMEHLPGGTMADRLGLGAQARAQAFVAMPWVLSGLAAIHRNGLVHGDLKPGNILFAADGTPRITDFGSAIEVDAPAAEPGETRGTPAYMSPEAAAGQPLTPASDIYSAGAILQHLVTGRTYLDLQGTRGDMIRAIQEDPPTALPQTVPLPMAEAIRACLAKDPAHRPQSATELMGVLEGLLAEGFMGHSSRPAGAARHGRPTSR